MKLISCGNCGVVLDTDKISYPNIYLDEGDGDIGVNLKVAYWDGEEYVAKIRCPACKDSICYVSGNSV